MTASRRLAIALLLSLFATALLAQEPPAQQPTAQEPTTGQEPTVTRTTEPVTAETDQDVNNPRALKLSLDDAVHAALEKNLGIHLQELDYQKAGYSLRSAYGIYDAFGNALIQEISAQTPVTSTIESSSFREHDVNLSVGQNLPAGGNYSLGFNNSREAVSGGVSLFSPKYSPNVSFSLSQPLLRDFGIDINRRGITVARNTLGINQEAFRSVVIQTTANVEQAYLQLVYARRAVDVVKESLFLARDQARITQIRIDVGASAPLDILQPRVTIASTEDQLILAVADVRKSEDNLRALLHLDSADWDRPILPTDPVEYKPMTIDVADAVKRALELRPEIHQADLGTDSLRVQYLFARNQTLPGVDLSIRYGLAGVAGNAEAVDPVTGQPTGAIERIPYSRGLRNIYEADFPSWTIGFNVSVPLTNIGARAEAKRAELDYKQSKVQKEQTSENITVQVRLAAREVDTAAHRIVATRAARDAAEKNVEAERRRYENGMTTNFQVLQNQQLLTDARVNELQALVGYNQAVAAFHLAVGDILQVRNITVDAPEVPNEPHVFSTLDKYNWLNYGSRVHLEDEPK